MSTCKDKFGHVTSHEYISGVVVYIGIVADESRALDAVMKEMRSIVNKDPSAKLIVFSEFPPALTFLHKVISLCQP